MVMQRACLALLSLLMLALTLSGCGVPQEEHDAVVTELESARSEIKDLQAELASLQSEIENLEDELNTPENERIKNLQIELASLSARLVQIQSSNAALQEQILELENELSTTMTLAYPFTYKDDEYNLTLNITLRDYLYYKEKPRPSWTEYSSMATHPYYYFAEYRSMATDPNDDYLIDSIVNELNEAVAANNLSELEKLRLVLTFVQSLTYAEDNVTARLNEYPRYPVETLFDRGGDCEDTSILLAAILMEMGYDVALLLFEEFDHIGLGLNFPLEYGNSWIHDGKRYWYLDTTGGRSIGWCPEEYAQTSAYVYPVGG